MSLTTENGKTCEQEHRYTAKYLHAHIRRCLELGPPRSRSLQMWIYLTFAPKAISHNYKQEWILPCTIKTRSKWRDVGRNWLSNRPRIWSCSWSSKRWAQHALSWISGSKQKWIFFYLRLLCYNGISISIWLSSHTLHFPFLIILYSEHKVTMHKLVV